MQLQLSQKNIWGDEETIQVSPPKKRRHKRRNNNILAPSDDWRSRLQSAELDPGLLSGLVDEYLEALLGNDDVVPHFTWDDIKTIAAGMAISAIRDVLSRKTSRKRLTETWAWMVDESSPFPFAACVHAAEDLKELSPDEGLTYLQLDELLALLALQAKREGVYLPVAVRQFLAAKADGHDFSEGVSSFFLERRKHHPLKGLLAKPASNVH